MEAGLMKRILLSGSGILYKIYNIYILRRIVRDEMSRRIVRAELSAPSFPARIVRESRCQRYCIPRTTTTPVHSLSDHPYKIRRVKDH